MYIGDAMAIIDDEQVVGVAVGVEFCWSFRNFQLLRKGNHDIREIMLSLSAVVIAS